MSNLSLRIISALVMGTIGISAIVLNLYSRWIFISLVLTLATWEYSRMITTKFSGPKINWFPAGLVLFFCFAYYPGFNLFPKSTWNEIGIVLSVILTTLIGFRFVSIANLAPWIFLQLFGCAYFGLYTSALFNLMHSGLGWTSIYPILMVQFCMATADTGAYIVGKAMGKHKLCPTISSGKTIEGAIGGAVFTVLLTISLGKLLLGTEWPTNLGLGIVMSATAILGDLFISILKRFSGFKDSSQLIPGHGGILDRFDSLLFSAPVAVLYLQLF